MAHGLPVLFWKIFLTLEIWKAHKLKSSLSLSVECIGKDNEKVFFQLKIIKGNGIFVFDRRSSFLQLTAKNQLSYLWLK